VSGENLLISLRSESIPIAVHQLSKEKEKVITDPKHRQRSQSKRDRLAEEIMEKLANQEDSIWLINTLKEHYIRHIIEQFEIVLKSIMKYPTYINDALIEMKRLGLKSANDLRDIAISLEIEERRKLLKKEVINEKYKDLVAPERKRDIYLQFFKEEDEMKEFYYELQEKCKSLRLAETAKELPNMLREAELKGWT